MLFDRNVDFNNEEINIDFVNVFLMGKKFKSVYVFVSLNEIEIYINIL